MARAVARLSLGSRSMKRCRAASRSTARSSAAILSIQRFSSFCVRQMSLLRPCLIVSVVATLASCATQRHMESPVTPTVTRAPYGRLPDGRAVDVFTLANASGVVVRAMTYGAIITAVRTPDRAGHLEDITLGFDSLPGYLGEHPYFGALIGRYANRIARGQFTLDGATYHLARNNGPNSLHGGERGFDKVVWSGTPFQSDSTAGVTLRYESPDGEEGYPGAVSVQVTYTLTDADDLIIEYEASTTKATPINLSQHTYWNLHGAGDILSHVLTLKPSACT